MGMDGDFVFLGWIHDELQVACRERLGDRVGSVLARCAQEAGKPFGFRVPLASDYKIGNDWSQTH
jgi:DNA polymerase-1